MMMIGTAVDNIPRLRPPMMIVAEPVSDLSASFWVGLYVSDVKYFGKESDQHARQQSGQDREIESDIMAAEDEPYQWE